MLPRLFPAEGLAATALDDMSADRHMAIDVTRLVVTTPASF